MVRFPVPSPGDNLSTHAYDELLDITDASLHPLPDGRWVLVYRFRYDDLVSAQAESMASGLPDARVFLLDPSAGTAVAVYPEPNADMTQISLQSVCRADDGNLYLVILTSPQEGDLSVPHSMLRVVSFRGEPSFSPPDFHPSHPFDGGEGVGQLRHASLWSRYAHRVGTRFIATLQTNEDDALPTPAGDLWQVFLPEWLPSIETSDLVHGSVGSAGFSSGVLSLADPEVRALTLRLSLDANVAAVLLADHEVRAFELVLVDMD